MPVFVYETPIGKVGIEEKENAICKVYFEEEEKPSELEVWESPLLKEASLQLKSYFEGTLKEFDLPLCPKGTEFMQTVWDAICMVPYGQTISYSELARKIERPRAQRAVGRACNRNPIPIFIPCHRIIGANNQLIGYGGGLHIKKALLLLETNHISY